uniref:kelch-like protein 26 n=1 Tax=Styela clava TaxID=7725 RepID=UPI0019399669|nr:kelch-like protein 26 [Styela clava]
MKMNSKVMNQVRAKQSDRLMTSYDRFKEKGFLCDFNINVGEKSFRVHRTVLAASSEYFESMFSSNLKEVHDGHINMKDVDLDGIAQCVEFMYKGKADLKIENIQHILHASNLLQMVELTNLCFQFLEINISPINCLSVINLAQMYDRRDIKQQAVQVVIDNFESVISSEMFPFITKSDLLLYISNQTYQTLWKAVVTWAKGKDKIDVSELFKIEQFPFKFLLETVLKEPIVKNNKTAEKSVITALFSDVKKLETNLDIDNCFILKNLSETNQTPIQATVKDSIILFLETNFEQISKKKEFLDISKDDILRLFKSSETKYSSEAVKYEGMMKWVKHDVKNRRKIFQDLFSLLKLGDLSLEFLKETVRIEPLVKKSDKCNDLLIDEIFSRASLKAEEKPKAEQPLALPVSKDDEEGSSVIGGASGYGTASSRPANGAESQSPSQTTSDLRVINQQPSDGKWSWDWLQKSLPGYEGDWTHVITYSFPAGSLKVSYETNLFVG